MNNSAFVSADWLEERLGQPGLAIVDGSMYLPAHGRNALAEYQAGHIPGAVFFDHDESVEPGSTLSHQLPSPENFALIAGAKGISDTDTIVVYDGPGLFASARTRWIFKVFGVENVFILEGGLDGWKREGRPLTEEPTAVVPVVFTPHFHAERVVSLGEMLAIVESGSSQIADARPAGRFEGVDPEPRAGMRGGHMPGARSLPATSLSREGRLLPAAELRKMMDDAGIDLDQPVVTSCGSGVTAAVISLALEALGRSSRLYDGSWAEWGSLQDTPIVKGKAD